MYLLAPKFVQSGKRLEITRIMSFVERYKNLYFCDCA